MRNTFPATIGLIAAIGFGATAASAEPASLTSCVQARDKVSEALAKDTSANHAAAAKESNYGRDFCNTGLYQRGMEHYAQAMKLLGIS
jgi:hypothetical protein